MSLISRRSAKYLALPCALLLWSLLEHAGYVAVEKRFVGKRPNTRLSLTDQGCEAFTTHLDALRAVVEAGPKSVPGSATPVT